MKLEPTKPEVVSEIIRWYLTGKDHQWIANRMGVAKSLVTRKLNEFYRKRMVGSKSPTFIKNSVPYRKDLDEYSGHWMGAEREDNR
jgi:hypothetical protein